jgi:hypothetical protein
MANEIPDKYKLYLAERERLIDAGRESARTFDQAVLAFGSIVFGFSIAFLKDIAPKPAPETLKWLGTSWLLFSLGILAILLSFLFSHRACMFEIENSEAALGNSSYEQKKNPWSIATNWCNVTCVVFLFLGLSFWSIFAFDNLSHGDAFANKVVQAPAAKTNHVSPHPTARAPSLPTAPPTSQPIPQK